MLSLNLVGLPVVLAHGLPVVGKLLEKGLVLGLVELLFLQAFPLEYVPS